MKLAAYYAVYDSSGTALEVFPTKLRKRAALRAAKRHSAGAGTEVVLKQIRRGSQPDLVVPLGKKS